MHNCSRYQILTDMSYWHQEDTGCTLSGQIMCYFLWQCWEIKRSRNDLLLTCYSCTTVVRLIAVNLVITFSGLVFLCVSLPVL